MNSFDKPQMPAILATPPAVTPPARMPDPNDPAVIDAKRRAMMDALSRGGRSSTILTGPKPAARPSATTVGADSYSGASL